MVAIGAAMPEAVLFSLFGHTLPLSELKRDKSVNEARYLLLLRFTMVFWKPCQQAPTWLTATNSASHLKSAGNLSMATVASTIRLSRLVPYRITTGKK